MANTFNKDFKTALENKLENRSAQTGLYNARANLRNQQAGVVNADARSAIGVRGAQARLYNEQASNFGRTAESAANLNDQQARTSRIGANIELGKGLADQNESFFNTSVKDLEGGGIGGAATFSPQGTNLYGDDLNPSGVRGQYGDPFAPERGDNREENMRILGNIPNYAAGGVVSPMVDPDYELYRDAATKAGVSILPPQEAMQRMAQLRAAKRAQVMQMIEQGGTTPQGYASGGMIEGPGTGKSDSIPATVDGVGKAAVSDGEFLIPKHVVDYFGTKMLDGLVEKARMAGKANARKPGYAQGGAVKKPASKLSVAEVDKLTPADMQALHKADMEANQKYKLTAEDLKNAAAAGQARARFEQKAAMALPEGYVTSTPAIKTYGDLYAHLQGGKGVIDFLKERGIGPN